MMLNGNEMLGGLDAWEIPIPAPKSPDPPPNACQGICLNAITVITFYFFNEEDLEGEMLEGESQS